MYLALALHLSIADDSLLLPVASRDVAFDCKTCRRAIELDGDVPGAYQTFLDAQHRYQSVPFNHNPGRGLHSPTFQLKLSRCSHSTVFPCLIDWGKIMHPTYPTECAYVEPKSGRV